MEGRKWSALSLITLGIGAVAQSLKLSCLFQGLNEPVSDSSYHRLVGFPLDSVPWERKTASGLL